MQTDITLTWSDSMYKGNDLAELTFGEALDRELEFRRSENEVIKTTVHIPLWIRAAIARVHVERGVSEGKLYTAIINHGASVIKRRYGKRIKQTEKVRYKLLKSDNDIIKSLVGDFRISVNGVQGKDDKRTIRIPIWCKEYLGAVGAALRMEFSSMIRLALYLSFQTCDSLTKKDENDDNEALFKFEQKFGDYNALCILLEPSTIDGYVPVCYDEGDD